MLLFLLGCIMSGEPDKTQSYSVDWVEVGYRRITSDIADSSIRISIMRDGEEAGHGSGNYFEYRGKDFVVTAAHVVDNEMDMAILDGNEKVKIKIVFIDFENDVAILKTEKKLVNSKPMRWVLNKSGNLAGSEIYYSGFPSHYGKLLISGMVSSIENEGAIIQAFALPGSSGSVVFDKHGRAVGVVSAVGLHASQFSPFPSIQEDIVFISRVSHLDTRMILEVLKCAE